MYDQFVNYEWEKGLAGSGMIDFSSVTTRFEAFGPEIAESFKIPEVGTWIFQIRKGVRYALDPGSEASRLVNGRELTADDAVWNVRRLHTDPAFPNAGPRYSHPAMSKAATAEKTGPWEITLKTPVDPWTGFFWVVWGGCSQNMYAREVIEKYGNAENWRNMVGTGPFMISDYVSQSVVTFKRNPNWYKKDPVGSGKGNQVPYVDIVKLLIVPDLSTRLATMRTGKADWVSAIESEDARTLIKTSPQLKYQKYLARPLTINMRTELAELPFRDIRVRQALTMAIDYDLMKRDLYEGDAEAPLMWPVAPPVDWLFIPLEKLPVAVQTIYKFSPDGAKKLLAEAGYPKGFKTKMMVQNSSIQMDPASVVKEMWAKVGVEVELQPRDFAIWTAAGTARSWEEMRMNDSAGTNSIVQIFEMSPMRGVTSRINDPKALQAYDEMQKNVFVNMPKVDEIYRGILPYFLEQAYVIPVASSYSYTLWQPWVKNHHGETGLGLWPQYAWIDQDLKEKMTGRR